MAHKPTVHVRSGLQPVQVIAGLVGIVYLAAGVLGFVRTGLADWSVNNMQPLSGFMVNPWHNLLHVVVGVIGLLFMMRPATSRLYGWMLLIGFGALTLWGLALQGTFTTNPVSGLGNPFGIDRADTWLHFGTAVVGLVIAVLPARRKIVIETPETEPVTEPVATPAAETTEDPQPTETTTTPAADHRRWWTPWRQHGVPTHRA